MKAITTLSASPNCLHNSPSVVKVSIGEDDCQSHQFDKRSISRGYEDYAPSNDAEQIDDQRRRTRCQTHLQLCPLHPLPGLVKVYLRTLIESLLQGTSDLDRLHRPGQLQRYLDVVETGGRELVGLGHEGVLEPTVIVLRDLFPDAVRFPHVHEAALRVGVDRQFALGADDLGHVVLARCHHSAAVKVCNLSAPKLHHADAVVDVLVLPQLRLYGGDAHGCHGFHDTVLTEEPQRQIDVVDVAVHEDAARKLGVFDKETGRVQFIARLRPEDRGSPDGTLVHARPGVSVGCVEAPGESAQDG